jgi:hypothetical protein
MIGTTKDWPKGGYDLSRWETKQIRGRKKYQTENCTTYQKSSTKIATHQDRTRNSMGTNLGTLPKIKLFWCHETIMINPHTRKSETNKL